MTLGTDEQDELAYDLVRTDFDAVERNGYRAAWTPDNTTVVVADRQTGDKRRYDGEDLLRAASDTDVRNARNPTASQN
jgi:hypothetical protein